MEGGSQEPRALAESSGSQLFKLTTLLILYRHSIIHPLLVPSLWLAYTFTFLTNEHKNKYIVAVILFKGTEHARKLSTNKREYKHKHWYT